MNNYEKGDDRLQTKKLEDIINRFERMNDNLRTIATITEHMEIAIERIDRRMADIQQVVANLWQAAVLVVLVIAGVAVFFAFSKLPDQTWFLVGGALAAAAVVWIVIKLLRGVVSGFRKWQEDRYDWDQLFWCLLALGLIIAYAIGWGSGVFPSPHFLSAWR